MGDKVLTKRRVLGFLMGQYDPLGTYSHYLLTGKLLLRRLHGKSAALGWDEVLPAAEHALWARFIEDAVSLENIRIPHAVKMEAGGQFWIVAFWDGLLEAHACVLYARHQQLDE